MFISGYPVCPGKGRLQYYFLFFLLFFGASRVVSGAGPCWGAEQAARFAIDAFEVYDNTVLPEDDIRDALAGLMGEKKTVEDVEKARAALEKLYHDKGYVSVFVNIPEQSVDEGTVKLEVVEGKVGKLTVADNKYYTRERLLKDLPSLGPGEILYGPQIEKELNKVNAAPGLKVTPILGQGKEPGTVDVELKVQDQPALHGSLELNNDYSANTSPLRASAVIHYDNLWQKDHTLSLQYQMSPLNAKQVEVFAGSYVLPVPWKSDDRFALYGVKSDSNSAFGEGFHTVGKGDIIGGRYVLSLPFYKSYAQSITIGLDYKDFQDATGLSANSMIKTPVTYFPLSFGYSSSLTDPWGLTVFSSGLNMVFRGLVTNQEEFENKRFKGEGDYIYGTLGVERTQKLPGDTKLYVKLDGQISDQPLINNEQYSAGGLESVRGYKQADALGDNAMHTTVEFSAPELLKFAGLGDKFNLTPYAFFDYADLLTLNPLPSEQEAIQIYSAGSGMRGTFSKWLEYDMGIAVPLANSQHTARDEVAGYFRVKSLF
jgi:hemolysin activation/secretion protein